MRSLPRLRPFRSYGTTLRVSLTSALLLTAVAAPVTSAADPESASAAERARSVVGQSGFQGEIPELERIVSEECQLGAGGGGSRSPRSDGSDSSGTDSDRSGASSEAQQVIAQEVGRAAASAAPVASAVLMALTLLIVVIVAGVVLLMIFRAFDRRRHAVWIGQSGSAITSGEPELQLAPIEDAERFAAAGDYAAAAHLLLQHVLRRLTRRAGSRLVPSQTSREVLRGLRLERQQRRDVGVLMNAVERSFFGGRELSRRDYEACREVCRSSFDLLPGPSR